MISRLRDKRSWVGRSTEAGAIALITAILVPVLLILVAFAADIGRWYVEVAKVQKAADAAALAGVTWMPAAFNQGFGGGSHDNAVGTALDTATVNGYTDADGSYVAGGANYPQVIVTGGDRPSELLVTVTSRVNNSFARLFGLPTTVISRSAVADYVAPAIMGSPCNAIGNQPPSNTSGSTPNPAGTVIPNSSTQGGYSTCQTTANFWTAIEGPTTNKIQGDRYATRVCQSGVDGCSGTTNSEYNEENYYFVVRVQPAAVNTPINLQLYDPTYADTGQTCEDLPSTTWSGSAPNPFVVNATEAGQRYDDTENQYCTGDNDPGGSGTQPGLTTSFAVRQQTDTQNPSVAPVQNDTSGNPCIMQFRGVTSAPTANQLTSSSGSYNRELARVFHQWVDFCTFTPTRRGDYYIQVRTNVSLGGTAQNSPNTNGNNPIIYKGNTNVLAATGNDTSGRGANAFAIRAYVNGCTAGSTAATCTQAANVSVAGYQRMPIFINADNTATFNLLQVLPNAAGQKIFFSFFDGGDATGNGAITVLPPVSYGGSAIGPCTGTGPVSGTLTGCNVTISNATHNGKTQTISVQIPNDYTCAGGVGDCWYRVQISFGGGSVHDFTTWDANIGGDPVRLLR